MKATCICIGLQDVKGLVRAHVYEDFLGSKGYMSEGVGLHPMALEMNVG